MKHTKTIRWSQTMLLATLGGGLQSCAQSLDDLPCPCASGWSCCAADHICYQSALSCPSVGGVGTSAGSSSSAGVGTGGATSRGGTAGVAGIGGVASSDGPGGTGGVASPGGTGGVAGPGGTGGVAGPGGTGGVASPGGTGGSTVVNAGGAIELSGGGAGPAGTGNVSVDSAGVAGMAGAGGKDVGKAGTGNVGSSPGGGGISGSAGARNEAGTGQGGSAGGGNTYVTCPATGGPIMTSLPLGFCIDSTEVTRAQYQAWLSSNPPTTGQIPDCTWNTSFTPQGDWSSPNTNPNNPVAFVNWCDAYAYCQGVGKRLCGKIGGGSNAFADYANATLSQWHAACTSNGASDYPYGDAYVATTCNGNEAAHGATVAVRSMTDCHSLVNGYTGVYDLSGNVYEWEDSCTGAGKSATCRGRGGGFNDTDRGSGSLACDSPLSGIPRDAAGANIGFRCCAL